MSEDDKLEALRRLGADTVSMLLSPLFEWKDEDPENHSDNTSFFYEVYTRARVGDFPSGSLFERMGIYWDQEAASVSAARFGKIVLEEVGLSRPDSEVHEGTSSFSFSIQNGCFVIGECLPKPTWEEHQAAEKTARQNDRTWMPFHGDDKYYESEIPE